MRLRKLLCDQACQQAGAGAQVEHSPQWATSSCQGVERAAVELVEVGHEAVPTFVVGVCDLLEDVGGVGHDLEPGRRMWIVTRRHGVLVVAVSGVIRVCSRGRRWRPR